MRLVDSETRDDDALRAAAEAWGQPGPAGLGEGYERWATPGGYWIHGGTLGAPGIEFVVWVAQAVGSGVLGNAAYDGLKQVISRVRQRQAARALSAQAEPELAGDEVMLIARLALRVLRIETGVAADGVVEIVSVVWSSEDERWEVKVRDQHGTVRCSVADADPTDVLVYGSRA